MWVAPALQIASSLFGGHEAKKAASAQQQGSQAGLDWIKNVYGQSQANFAPYLQAGQGGLSGLNALASGDYSGFMNSPDYLYAREQAIYGNDHSAAARGNLYSGGHSLDLAHEMNGIASQNLGNYRSSLMGLAGLGAQSASNLGSIGSGTMGPMQQGYNGIANAQAQGYGANAAMFGGVAGGLAGLVPQTSQSSYGGGANASTFGLPPPVDPYANASYGSSWFHA